MTEYSASELDSSGFQDFTLSHEPDLLMILKSVMSVTKSEARTYIILLHQQNADVQTLADELDRSPNTVREQLDVLREKRLITRDTRIAKRGKYYTYQAPSLAEAKSMLHDAVDRWVVNASDCVDCLEDYPTDGPLSLRTVTKVAFGFERPVMECYLALLEHPRCTARELAKIRNLARSTVSGRLNVLQDRGLTRPTAREIGTGTRIAYEYVPRPLDEVKEAMKEQLQEGWIEYAHRCIDEF
jgi:predicted transcriptional regulator